MQIVCGKVDGLQLNGAEVAARLQIPRGFSLDGVDQCLTRLMGVFDCRYAYVRVPVAYPADGVCSFDFARVKSRDLSKALGGASEAFLFAVTLGIGVDRLLHRLKLLSAAEHFITDALASAAAEALCDSVNRILAQSLADEADGRLLRPRFSPGYGDMPLSTQGAILRRLRADQTLSITLNEACLMTPMKSITAIAGLFDFSILLNEDYYENYGIDKKTADIL